VPHAARVTLFGDLERAFATNLYPLRVPIAIAIFVGLVGLIVVARRRGWFALARRHPARSTALVVVLLAIALPTGWYLGSPLLIRTSLQEPVPSADPSAPSTTTPGSHSTGGPATAAPSTAASVGPSSISPRTGTFHGADDFHFGNGTATLIETSPGVWTVRFEQFSVRNGPDLYVYLSSDPAGYGANPIELGALRATDGSFNTAVPAGADLTGVRSVVIWCKQFAVLFAVAPLTD
jgi:hypothetical protein